MCWGTLAVVVEVNGDVAKVDYGDGVLREVIIGVAEDRVVRGDIVIVHAGVVVSRLSRDGLLEQIRFFEEVLGDEFREQITNYANILALAEKIRGEIEVERVEEPVRE